MDMPKPTAAHKRLEVLAGIWEGKETMHPSQWDPRGKTAIGRTRSRLALSGFALIGEYEQEMEGKITFTGHSVTTYDPKREMYVMHWFDCMGSPTEVFEGGFEGDVLTMGHGGPGMHVRMTQDFGTPGKMQGKMEMSPDGTAWEVVFEGRYDRK